MNISETFIRRPIATSLIMAGYRAVWRHRLSRAAGQRLPAGRLSYAHGFSQPPGANPETMASSVATPLERQFTMIAGLDSMISSSSMGSTQITLQFDLGRDIDGATVDVETAIAEAMPLLPPGMPTPPSFRKVNPGDQPIIFLLLTSPTMRLSDLDEYAETLVAQRISMVSGVARCRSSAPPSMPCGCRRTPTSWRRARSASMNRQCAAQVERQHTNGYPVWAAHRLQRPGQRPAHACLAIPADDRRLPERPLSGCATWPT